jgi:CheY-like chemotaxis protein
MQRTIARIPSWPGREEFMALEPPADRGSSPRVLLVEDSKVNQLLVQAMMETSSYPVEVASSGEEALQRLAVAPYDIVLMDVSMPGMDGLQVTRALREAKDGPNARTRIIALTAHAMDGDREACLAAGMDDYLTKPINRRELLEKLALWADKGPRA